MGSPPYTTAVEALLRNAISFSSLVRPSPSESVKRQVVSSVGHKPRTITQEHEASSVPVQGLIES
jgi:hypothetical protein